MAEPIIEQDGVKLRDPEDFDSLRKDIFDGVKEEMASSFPKSYGGVRLEVHDLDYEGPEDWDYAAQRKALMHDDFLARKLRGTVRLVDEATGEVLDERRQSLMRVPWLTQRGTFVHGGNDWKTVMQSRLVPGPYTRRMENGGLETHFQPKPGTGRSFRLSFDPASSQYHLGVQSSSLHLYSLLRDMGHDDGDLEERWGSAVLQANASKYDSKVLPRAYKHLVPSWKQEAGVSREGMAEAVREALGRTEVNAAVARRTLPNWFDRTKSASWAARQAGAAAARIFFEKAASEMHFRPDFRPSDLLRARLEDHIGLRAEARLLATKRAAVAVDLDGTLAERPKGEFDPEVVGDPVPKMMERVRKWIDEGREVVIFTARAASPKNIPPVKKWLKEQGLPDLKVTCRKTPDLEELWDDRARQVKIDTGELVKGAAEVPHVELGERKSTYWICPHCKEEIHEKGSFLKDAQDLFLSGEAERPYIHVHSACGGEFIPPPPTPEEQAWLERLKSARVLPPVALVFEEKFEKEANRALFRFLGEALKPKKQILGRAVTANMPKVFKPAPKGDIALSVDLIHKTPRPYHAVSWSFVNEALRGMGVGRKLYGDAIRDAFTQYYRGAGPRYFVSDPTGRTSAEAAALWRGLAKRKYPVREKPDFGLVDQMSFGDTKKPAIPEFGIDLEDMKSFYKDAAWAEKEAELDEHELLEVAEFLNKEADAELPLGVPHSELSERVLKFVTQAEARLEKSAKLSPEKLQAARAVTDEPKSHAQAEAGNYAKGTLWWNGLRIKIENPKGSTRKGLNPDGTVSWKCRMHSDYGYVSGTRGKDGDEFDVFIGPQLNSEIVFVVDQVDQKTGEFDEHKAVLGCHTEEEARELYLKNYEDGWKIGPVRSMTFPQFKAWLRKGKRVKPLSGEGTVKMASHKDGFDPDLDSEEMQEAYDAVYGGTKPRLASMDEWPGKWMPPGSDSLGWINWYRGYLEGTRTDDDDRQIKRWKAFKARHGAAFKKNPTPRRAFALRYWAIDPLKLIEDPEEREEFKGRMEDYRAKETERWMREKTATLTRTELQALVSFLNSRHGAGIPLDATVSQMEEAVARFVGADDSEVSALLGAAEVATKSASERKGCLMADIPLNDTVRIVRWVQDNVPEADLASDGIERESHVTVLYGFSPGVTHKDVKPHLPDEVSFRLGRIKRFPANDRRPDSDVLVLEVESEGLTSLHETLCDAMGDRVQKTYKDYTPHLTLAYVKPGACKGLDGHARFDGEVYVCDRMSFSSAGGKSRITLKTR